jgi:hypothetical protein
LMSATAATAATDSDQASAAIHPAVFIFYSSLLCMPGVSRP